MMNEISYLKVGDKIRSKSGIYDTTIGRDYIIEKIAMDEERECYYIYLSNNFKIQYGFPVRQQGDVEYIKGIKIVYFDLHFNTLKEHRKLKLTQLMDGR